MISKRKETPNKRLAIIFSGDFPEGNTKNARLKTIADSLKSEGWFSTFVSVFPTKFSSSIQTSQPRQWNEFSIVCTSVSRRYLQPKILRYIQIISGQLGLLVWILSTSFKYDAYYFYCPRFTDTIVGLRLLKVLRKKIIVDQTELFSSNSTSRLHTKEEEWIAKYSDVLLVISKRLYSYFSSFKTRTLAKFPIMTDHNRFAIERNGIPYTMGYIGSFAEKDNIKLLLEATLLLVPKFPKLSLRLIGYSPNMQELKRTIMDMGIENNVEVTGTVAYEDIPWLLKECDTLLMNREESNFATYGYPIKLGEYFACSKPVIMSDGIGFSDDFTHRKEVYKYTVGDANALAETVAYRYRNIGESNAIAIRGYEYSKDHFASSKLVPHLANMLNQL
ncbi:glycosyltransferase [Bacteroidia bacterium]|nr:glycosyltransferase [Bacteroidia bacterium]